MAPVVIEIPRINDSRADFRTLAAIWAQTNEVNPNADIAFDFSQCDFLRPNAVVFLGGLARVIQHHGGNPRFLMNTMIGRVRTNLTQNGFAHAMGVDAPPWPGNSIPFREDLHQDEDGIVRNLRENWLGRGWMNVSASLAREVVSQIWEIYANAFEHSHSPVGVFTCGQHLPRQHELLLAVCDFGVGIPSNARLQLGPAASGAAAMHWAFQRGTSSAGGVPGGPPRGIGLDLLKEFIKLNGGRLEVYSHEGYARIDAHAHVYENLPTSFEGTLVQVTLRCDDKYYTLSHEVDTTPYF